MKKAGLIGCGDYLRWEIPHMLNSKHFQIKSTFDLDKAKSEKRAQELGAKSVSGVDEIFADKEIDIVCLFTPPWARLELFEKAVKAGKNIITTKPLANNIETAKKLMDMTQGKVKCAVFYGRAGNPVVETLKKIFASGEIGKLALYKEDWLHHYPQWNNWATDREKNGGPFMDAMIHNLNKSRYLIGSDVASVAYTSENFAQKLKCNDTESMRVNFKDGSASYLFITWAADLEVFSLDGNEREHYGILHMITDKGWYVKDITVDGQTFIQAKKEKEVKKWKVENLTTTHYDDFALAVEGKMPMKFDISDAVIDIEILAKATAK